MTDRFAAEGYLAIAPAMFDRVERDVELGYDQAGIARGMEIAGKVDRESAMQDVAAAIEAAKRGRQGRHRRLLHGRHLRLGRLGKPAGPRRRRSAITAAASSALKDLKPQVPTMLHFGEKDDHIPIAGVREVEALHPDVPVYIYPAGHGFHCDERASYDAPSAKLAWGRTLEFFGKHLG